MTQIIEILLSGITQGAVYCVVAVGLSLVYGASRILNFAHGSLYSLGGFLAWFLVVGHFNLPLWLAVLIAIPILAVAGIGIERLIIRPLRGSANWKINTIMVTLGLAFIVENGLQLVFGPGTKTIPPFTEGVLEIGGITLSWYRVWIFAISLALVASLEYFLSATRYGQAVRAVSQDMQGANQVGVNVNQVFSMTFALSVVLTGIAGILLAPVFLISPLGGWAPFLKAFVIVVLGGLGSTKGAFVAAFILAILEAFVIFYIGPSWAMPAWLVMLIAVLMIRPKGLFGVWEN
ncbi:branched-chain amino acid ABC transporter permease [Leisingera sp. F5]|uniref:branched-chain amino acid ABC transporter permease n=1 Tax=Leisingera sp. F5 TaxID=1813816 RepID=UPI000B0196C9|nr:branched-chain amino acid ABC transporter permease [Leisingera sp. F5]